jgi:transposase InsO family protein
MGKPKRQRQPPTEQWEQLELLFTSPQQRQYELIRPVVLFGQPAAERARETNHPQRTVSRHAKLFLEQGMASLFATPPASPTPRLPPALRTTIVDLKAEHPSLHLREIANICYVRYGRRPSIQTVKRILAETPPPAVKRRYPPFHQIDDPVTRRIAIIRLHAEGWNAKSIAAYLQTSRVTIHATLKRWAEEGFQGLPNKSSVPHRPHRKVDFRAMSEVRRLGRNPRIGAWRVHAALRKMGIKLSPATVGRMLALNRALYQRAHPPKQTHQKRPMPFRAGYRHQFWTVDIRYLDMHRIGGGRVYVIAVLENYSRAVLASAISRRQDTTAYLRVVHAAIEMHGSPDGIVSDSGGVFHAKKVLDIYTQLGIAKHTIDAGQPWQSYIETTFAIQQRMADYHFEQATTWDALQAAHDRWVGEYNHQLHWAHRYRDDGRDTPAEVLDWVYGTVWEPTTLQRVFHSTRFLRRLDTSGYVRFRHWRLYSEPGLARRSAVVWLYKEQLTISYETTELAHYTVEYAPDAKQIRDVTNAQVYTTRYQSPQLRLWQFGDEDWLKILRLPRHVRRRRIRPPIVQEHLFTL